jgi:hypothetical protein
MARIVREALQGIEWPLLTGEVELCDVNLAPRTSTPISIWLAIERRPSVNGFIRGWRVGHSLVEDFRRIATALDPSATVITPPSGLFRELKNLGFRQRGEPLGAADALPAVTATAGAFRRMLQARRHHGVSATTIETYLSEFVFRHNATVLGWSPSKRCRRVMTLLRSPRSSA